MATEVTFIHATEGGGELERKTLTLPGLPGSQGFSDFLKAAFQEWVGTNEPRPGDIFRIEEL